MTSYLPLHASSTVDSFQLWSHTASTFGSNSLDTTSLSCVCPLTPPSTTTSSLASSPLPTRSCPTTTPATSADGVAPRVSSTFFWEYHENPHCFQSSCWINHFRCCLQLEDSCPPSWSRPTCPSLTTRPAPAMDGGATLLRAPWSALEAAANPVARWAAKSDGLCPRVLNSFGRPAGECNRHRGLLVWSWCLMNWLRFAPRGKKIKSADSQKLQIKKDITTLWSLQDSVDRVVSPRLFSDLQLLRKAISSSYQRQRDA